MVFFSIILTFSMLCQTRIIYPSMLIVNIRILFKEVIASRKRVRSKSILMSFPVGLLLYAVYYGVYQMCGKVEMKKKNNVFNFVSYYYYIYQIFKWRSFSYCIGEVGVKSEGANAENQNTTGFVFVFITYCYCYTVRAINHQRPNNFEIVLFLVSIVLIN